MILFWLYDWARAGEGNPAGYRPGMGMFTAALALALLFAHILFRHERGPWGHGLERARGRERTSPDA